MKVVFLTMSLMLYMFKKTPTELNKKILYIIYKWVRFLRCHFNINLYLICYILSIWIIKL